MPITARRRLAALVVTPVVALTALAGTALPAQAVATVELEVTDTAITTGDSVTLSWTTSDDTETLEATGDWTGARDFPTGTEVVTPEEAGSYTFTLTATAEDDTTATDSVTVVVTDEDEELPEPGETELVETTVTCGSVRFTNVSDLPVFVLYGDEAEDEADGELELEPGDSDTVDTDRSELLFIAVPIEEIEGDAYQVGFLDVPQDCAGAGDGDADDADHPTVAPAAGVGDGSRTE